MLLVTGPDSHAYALKVMERNRLTSQGREAHVLSERAVMAAVSHPFVIALHATYRNRSYLYMLLEVSLGGELFRYLDECDRLDDEAARFYAASVALVLEYLHTKHIAYRDLKPENLLLSPQGYVKLCDFGFAKRVIDRTYTLCGTPEYLAPELISMKGHGRAVDWWALGCLVYELLMGYTPFTRGGTLRNAVRIYANIADHRKPFYEPDVTDGAKSLVRGLLTHNPLTRLGCRHGGARDVKAHRWFNGFDFDALLARELPPPYIPPVRSALDTSCFDEYELPEEDLLFLDHEDSPRVAAASTPAQRRDSCDSFKSVASDAPDDWAATF